MARALTIAILTTALLMGCGESDDGIEGAPKPGSMRSGTAPDLSTPEAAVRSFCGAAEAKDVPRMGACIEDAAGEKDLRRIALGRITPDDVEDIARTLALRTVRGTEISPDGMEAWVDVTFKSGRDERIRVVKTPVGWKIDDF